MSFVDWEAWAPDDDERALAVQEDLDDQQDQQDREDRDRERGDVPPGLLMFDQPRLGLAPRERHVNRRTVEDVVIGGLLAGATATSVLLAFGLVVLAVELLP